MKKIIASVLCFTMCAAMFAGCNNGSSDEKSTDATGAAETETAAEGDTTVSQTETVEVGTGEITLNVYAMSAEVPGMITEYFKRNPDVASKYKVEAMVSSNDNQAYETKLNAALAAGGSDAPDLYVAEADYLLPYTVGELSSFAAPYADFIDDVDGKIATAEVAKYVQELGTNADGKLVALNYQCTGGAMIYRTDLAEEVLGAKTPEEVEAAIGAGTNSWDKFWEVADKMKEKGYAIVSGADDVWNVIEKASAQPWVVDNKLTIDDNRMSYLDISKKLYEGNYTNKTDSWSEAWYADMKGAGEKQVFCFFGPCWLINYVMANHVVDEATLKGKYNVCTPPVGFWWGGSWLLANKDAIADPDKKEIISKIVEWITMDATEDGLQYAWANGTMNEAGTKDTVSCMAVLNKADGSMDILGGQDPFKIFINATSYANGNCKCLYDSTINSAFKDQAKAYAAGEKDKDAAVAEFKDKVAEMGIEV